MANIIDENGIQIQTYEEVVDELNTSYKGIYGQDINISSDAADGQMIGIQAQAKMDMLNYSVYLYNCFNVDTVSGTPQDILYKLNNVYRKSSEFTFIQVNVVVNKAPVSLEGLDSEIANVDGVGYTLSDSNGNQVILTNSVVITETGEYTLEFRAKDLGKVVFSPNTITTMVSVVEGIESVSNLTSQYITGTDEESDSDFRIRRNSSTAISGKGFQDALEAQLQEVAFVSFSKVYNNTTNAVDSDGIPAHGFWAIVEGGENEDIANVIYANMGMGNPMKGEVSYTITKDNGDTVDILFDRPSSEDLYIEMTVKSKTGIAVDTDYIKSELIKSTFEVYEAVDVSQIIAKTIGIDENLYVLTCKISNDGSTWVDYLIPSEKDKFFALKTDNIEIVEVV